jgi:hypothetical protein
MAGLTRAGWGTLRPGRGTNPEYRRANIVNVPSVGGVTIIGGMHRAVAPLAAKAINAMIQAGFNPNGVRDDWGYADRMVQKLSGPSTTTKSNHAWGLAFDLDATQNGLGLSLDRASIKARHAAAAARFGFSWGGNYRNTKDAMHFEFLGTPADVAKYGGPSGFIGPLAPVSQSGPLLSKGYELKGDSVSPRAIYEAALAAGFVGSAALTITAIALAESRGRAGAIGDKSIAGQRTADGRTWGPSIGLTQVRSIVQETGKGTIRDRNRLTTVQGNLNAAYGVYREAGQSFRPWATFTTSLPATNIQNYRYWLPLAAQAASGEAGSFPEQDGEGNPHTTFADILTRPIQRGDIGLNVSRLQGALGLDKTGRFDAKTQKAVEDYLRKRNVPVEAVINGKTVAIFNLTWGG